MRTEITAVQKSQEVSALLAVPGSRIIAGGTTFMPEGEEGVHLVDISGLEGFDGIRKKGNRLEIGPLAVLEELGNSVLLKACAPALAECAADAATPSVRQRGTLGGNLASERIGDAAPALLASGAKLTIRTDSDFRDILIDRFWDNSGKNNLDYDEWITRITIPIPEKAAWGAAFARDAEWDLAKDPKAAAAVQLSLDEKNMITSIRGGIRIGTSLIRRMFPLEKALKNSPAVSESFEKAARVMTASLQDHLPDAGFSETLTGILTDILERSTAMAEERRTL